MKSGLETESLNVSEFSLDTSDILDLSMSKSTSFLLSRAILFVGNKKSSLAIFIGGDFLFDDICRSLIRIVFVRD